MRLRISGFTLVELSIVLVILGLLVGGVLAGQSLIHAAQLNKQLNEWEQFQVNVNAFKLKYLCLPGDCENASAFFPGAQNGNGNQRIESTGSVFWTTSEASYIFQHLLAAGLGNLNGNAVWAVAPVPGVEIGKMYIGSGDTFWWITTPVQPPSGTGPFIPSGRNYIATAVATNGTEFRAFKHDPPYNQEYGALFTQDAYSIDRKVDDGMPVSGRILTTRSFVHPDYWQQLDRAGTYCVAGDGNYNVGYTATPGCSLMIQTSF